MKDMMSHKGYSGSVHYDDEARLFYGKIEFIRALTSYEATNAKQLRAAFEEAVEDYLELCRTQGIEPEVPFKGSFNVRVGAELHRRAAVAAKRKNTSLNKFVAEALEKATNRA